MLLQYYGDIKKKQQTQQQQPDQQIKKAPEDKSESIVPKNNQIKSEYNPSAYRTYIPTTNPNSPSLYGMYYGSPYQQSTQSLADVKQAPTK